MIKTIKQTTAENLKLKIHLPDTKDEIRRLADTFNDMIERLDRSFSSQQGFIQGISAELKAPLAEFKKEFEAARDGSLSPQAYDSLMSRGIEEINRSERIIEELESLARFDNNRMALEIRKVNLSRLLEKALDNVRPDALEKEIGLSSVLKDAVIVDGDEKQLRRLFANLLDNAVKYTNRKGSVTISARRDRKNAVIVVNDTGIGMDEGELPYIFDRFYQVNKSRASNGSFGLGLSIAKSVAEVHKGAILVESKPGKGSTFTVLLPLSYPA
jgi:signal transduction histidine kinase